MALPCLQSLLGKSGMIDKKRCASIRFLRVSLAWRWLGRVTDVEWSLTTSHAVGRIKKDYVVGEGGGLDDEGGDIEESWKLD